VSAPLAIAVGLVIFLLQPAPFSWVGLSVLAVATAAEILRRERRAR
jgi:hypothetical protein